MDNKMFVMATNSKELALAGVCKVTSLFNLNHRTKLDLNDEEYTKTKVLPYMNHLYNNKMNGVDILDQYVSSYDKQHRFSSWKLQAYHTSFNILESIAYRIHQNAVATKKISSLTHLQFKQSIATQLLTRASPRLPTSTIDINSDLPSDMLEIDELL